MKNRLGIFAFISAVFSGTDRLWDDGDAGGGGVAIAEDAWPDIPVPGDVPRSEPTPAPSGSTPPPAPTPAPPAPGASNPPPGTPQGGAPATPAPAGAPGAVDAPPATAPDRMEEFQRAIAEVTGFNRQLLEQNAALIAEVRQLRNPATPPPAAEPPAPALSEADIKVRDRLYAIMPGLKILDELVAKKDAIFGAAEAVPQITADREAATAANQQYWASYREAQFAAARDAVAKEMLGEGKTGKDLDPMVQGLIAEGFRTWVTSDPQRAARYENQDQTLLGEFAAHYKALMIAPLRRTENVAALDAAAAAPPIPRGGPSIQPGPAVTPPAPPKDEDALYSQSWDTFQTQRRTA